MLNDLVPPGFPLVPPDFNFLERGNKKFDDGNMSSSKLQNLMDAKIFAHYFGLEISVLNTHADLASVRISIKYIWLWQ